MVVGGFDGKAWLVTVARPGDVLAVPGAVATAPLGTADMPRTIPRVVTVVAGDRRSAGLDEEEGEDPLVRLDVLLGGILSDSEQPIERLASSLLIEAPELRATVRDELRRHCASIRTVTVQLAWGDVDADQLPDADAEQLAEAVAHRWSVPTVPSQYFASAIGTEQQFVRGYDVEIAQKAATPNPIMQRTFTGLDLNGTVDARSDGGFALRLDARWSAQDALLKFDVNIKGTGGLHLQRAAVTEFSIDEPMTPLRWHLVGTVPDPSDSDRQVVLLARIR